MTNVLRRSIDTFVEMQQNFLSLANKTTQGWLQSEDGKLWSRMATIWWNLPAKPWMSSSPPSRNSST